MQLFTSISILMNHLNLPTAPSIDPLKQITTHTTFLPMVQYLITAMSLQLYLIIKNKFKNILCSAVKLRSGAVHSVPVVYPLECAPPSSCSEGAS